MNDIFVLPLRNSSALCLVDAEVAPRLTERQWSLYGKYITSCIGKSDYIYLHQYLKPPTYGQVTDHRNGFKFDNRLHNLRAVSKTIDVHNKPKRSGLSSKFKGVSYDNARNMWAWLVTKYGEKVARGRCKTEVEAARAYNEAAIKFYGNNATLNNI
jgi:hypothetical protein